MNALVTLESILTPASAPLSAETLFGTGQVETIVSAIEAQVRAEAIDISTADGRKAAKSLAYKVARSKTILDEIGKEHVAEIKAQSAKIDAERKTLRDRLDGLKAEVSGPVEKWEQAEADRVSTHEGALVAVIEAARQAAGKSAGLIYELINIIEGYAARDWQEFKERADVAVTEALATLNGALADAEQREKDAAELAELRRLKAERDAADAKAAAEQAAREEEARAAEWRRQREEQAQRDLERAVEIARQEEIERAEKARIETEARAEREKAQAIEEERRRVAAEEARKAAEKAAQEAAERKKQESTRHRNKVHKAIGEALVEHLFHDTPDAEGDELVSTIIEHIAAGRIPHVSITY